jgi:hypothetical protein
VARGHWRGARPAQHRGADGTWGGAPNRQAAKPKEGHPDQICPLGTQIQRRDAQQAPRGGGWRPAAAPTTGSRQSRRRGNPTRSTPGGPGSGEGTPSSPITAATGGRQETVAASRFVKVRGKRKRREGGGRIGSTSAQPQSAAATWLAAAGGLGEGPRRRGKIAPSRLGATRGAGVRSETSTCCCSPKLIVLP